MQAAHMAMPPARTLQCTVVLTYVDDAILLPHRKLCLQVVTLQEPGLDAALLGPGPTPMLAELETLAQRYANERTRAELGQAWRPGLSRLHKLMASLEAWLGYCPAKQRRQFLHSLQPLVQAAWALQGSVQVRTA